MDNIQENLNRIARLNELAEEDSEDLLNSNDLFTKSDPPPIDRDEVYDQVSQIYQPKFDVDMEIDAIESGDQFPELQSICAIAIARYKNSLSYQTYKELNILKNKIKDRILIEENESAKAMARYFIKRTAINRSSNPAMGDAARNQIEFEMDEQEDEYE